MKTDINRIASYLGVSPLLIARELVEPQVLVDGIDTLSAALNVYENSIKGTDLFVAIEEKLTQIGARLLTVANFEEAHRIWHIAPEDSRLSDLADEKMALMYKDKLSIATLEDAERIFVLAPEGCKLKNQARHKVNELKKEKILIANYEIVKMIWDSSSDKKVREMALNRITELKSNDLKIATYEEAVSIKRAAAFMNNKTLENLAIIRMIELVKANLDNLSFYEARNIWDDAANYDELRSIALERMNIAGQNELELGTLIDVKIIWKRAPYPQAAELRKKALNRILQLI